MRFLLMVVLFIFIGLGFSSWLGVFAWYIPALMGLFSYFRCKALSSEDEARYPSALYPASEHYGSVWRVIILVGVVGAVLTTGAQFTSLTAKLEDTPNISHIRKQVAELMAEEQGGVAQVVAKQMADTKLPVYKLLVTCSENTVKIDYSLPAVKEGSTLVVMSEGIYRPSETCESQGSILTVSASLTVGSIGGPAIEFTPSPDGYAFFKKVASERKLELWIKQIQDEFAKEGGTVSKLSSAQH